jgi:hypothetical protein
VTGVGVTAPRPGCGTGDPAAPRALARNELVLMGSIIGYRLLATLRESYAELWPRWRHQ